MAGARLPEPRKEREVGPFPGAAGRLTAAEGFEYAFSHIRRKDGVCVGIYAENAVDQIRQNATYTEMLTNS